VKIKENTLYKYWTVLQSNVLAKKVLFTINTLQKKDYFYKKFIKSI